MPIHGRVIRYVVEGTGAKLIPAAYKAFRKYDVRITNQLFGKSGGKGFRHGRDLGLIASEFLSGDELDEHVAPPGEITSRKFPKARRRDKRRSVRCEPVDYRRNRYRN